MASHTSFIKRLGREKATLNENGYVLSEYHGKAFKLCCELLREKEGSFAKRSRSRRSVRLRARSLLVDVYTGLGPEVFLLCILASSISNLATIPSQGLVPKLRMWWKTVSQPKGLTAIANQACEVNSIGDLIAPTLKGRLCGTTGMTDDHSLESTHARSSESPFPTIVHRLHNTPESHAESLDLDQRVSKHPETTSQINAQESSMHPISSNDPLSFTDTSSFDTYPYLDMQTADLFNFLEKHQGKGGSLRMMCPYTGSPLPWIEIRFKSSEIVQAYIQISTQMTAELIKFVSGKKQDLPLKETQDKCTVQSEIHEAYTSDQTLQ